MDCELLTTSQISDFPAFLPSRGTAQARPCSMLLHSLHRRCRRLADLGQRCLTCAGGRGFASTSQPSEYKPELHQGHRVDIVHK